MNEQMTKAPGAITKILPMEVILVEYINGEYKEEKAVMVVESGFMDEDPNSPELKDKLRVLDLYRNPPGEWRNTGKVTKWLAQSIQKEMKSNISEDSDEVENS